MTIWTRVASNETTLQKGPNDIEYYNSMLYTTIGYLNAFNNEQKTLLHRESATKSSDMTNVK